MPENFPSQQTLINDPIPAQNNWEGVAANYKNWHPGLEPHVEGALARNGYGHLIQEQPQPATPSMPESPRESEANWEYTYRARDVAELRQVRERNLGRAERPTIGRDSPILGGVYEGAYGGEAIVVNYKEDPELIDKATQYVIYGATDRATGKIDKSKIMDGVFNVVSSTMRYDSNAVENVFENGLNGQDGAKISLNAYIQLGVGVCRHQALYAGAVFENLRNQGYVRGHASVDRNMVRSGADGKYDGHAWVRYTNSAGSVYIIDVAQQKIGSLEQMMTARSKDPTHNWDYARPEDLASPYHPSNYIDQAGVINRVPWDNQPK